MGTPNSLKQSDILFGDDRVDPAKLTDHDLQRILERLRGMITPQIKYLSEFRPIGDILSGAKPSDNCCFKNPEIAKFEGELNRNKITP